MILAKKRRTRSFVSGLLLLLVTALLINPTGGASAQSTPDTRSLHWARWDVLIDQIDTTANSFQVTETYNLVVDAGPFHGGFRNIPLDRIDRIDNIRVIDNGKALPILKTANCPRNQAGIACVLQTSEEDITYVFASTLNTSDTRIVSITYTVYGALQSYAGGDQLDWSALPSDRTFDIQASRITVQLPPGLTPDKVATNPAWSQDQTATAGTLVFNSPGDLGVSSGVEVRVQYPHNPAISVPKWQITPNAPITSNATIPLRTRAVTLIVGLLVIAIARSIVH